MTTQEDDLGGSTALMLKTAGNTEIANWEDDKKRDFVKTFHDRARAAQYILNATSHELRKIALARHFIGARHVAKIQESDVVVATDDGCSWRNGTVGGRSQNELNKIAIERAKGILEQLPAARKAVEVIRPDIAKMMDRIDKLQDQGQKLVDRLEEMSGQVKLADLNQSMTVGALRQFIKDRDKEKRSIVERLEEIGTEGDRLENTVAKELYSGLPGLSDAVIKVINQHQERVIGLDQVRRRVEERVMFGDSKEAMSILEKFEKDEVNVSDEVKAEFNLALEKLQLAGKKAKAKLKAKS